jgi:hypothetical protein
VALLARSRRGFVLVVSWFAVYLLTKGTYIPASVEDASFWRILMPAFPAFVVLAASVVLLVPGLRARPEGGAFRLPDRKRTFAFAAAVAVFVVAPLGVVAAVPPLHDSGRKAVRQGDPGTLLPVSAVIAPRATVEGDGVRLSWRPQPAGASRVFYRILRTPGRSAALCGGRPENAADDCRIYMDAPAATHGISFLDRPGPGTWTYRIGVSANWLDDFSLGDIYVVSQPVSVTVR